MVITSFVEGSKFNPSGSLRTEQVNGSWYVLGEGMIVPVGGYQEGEEFIQELKRARETKSLIDKAHRDNGF